MSSDVTPMKTTAFQRTHARRADQRGATLIVLLVMLVVVTLLTLSSLRSTTQEERMAGNFRDRDKAFQAAEAVVQTCIAQVKAGTYPLATTLAPVAATAASGSTPANWDASDAWTNATKSTAVTITGAKLAADPRCMVETLSTGSFRVTGRAVGANADTVVILQATYSTE
jgi:type IV pilus assembly protein PilX